MCKDHSAASILLPSSIGLATATIIACYFWSDANRHLNNHNNPGEEPHWPFVSNMGDLAPEHYLFATGFAICAILLALASGIRFMQFRWALDWIDPGRDDGKQYVYARICNIILLVLNVFASGMLVVLSSFGMTEYKIAHFVGAGGFFFATTVYQCVHTAFTAYISRIVAKNKVVTTDSFFQPAADWIVIWYGVFNGILLVSMILAVGLYPTYRLYTTAIMEHFVIAAVLYYYIPWFWELKCATLSKVADAIGASAAGDGDI